MRLLLDENLDRRLKRYFTEGIEVRTVREQGWSSVRNGRLIRLAKQEFDALITMDKGIPHQQNLSSIVLIIVLLKAKSNRLVDLIPLVSGIKSALPGSRPGEVVRISAP